MRRLASSSRPEGVLRCTYRHGTEGSQTLSMLWSEARGWTYLVPSTASDDRKCSYALKLVAGLRVGLHMLREGSGLYSRRGRLRSPPERCEEAWKVAYSRERTHLMLPSGTCECLARETYVYLDGGGGIGGRTPAMLESRCLRDGRGAMGPTRRERGRRVWVEFGWASDRAPRKEMGARVEAGNQEHGWVREI